MTKEELIRYAKAYGADLVGIASMDRFEGAPPQMDPRFIMPDAKSMIVMAFRVMRGSLRGIEEGTFFSNYSAMGYGGLTYTYIPMTVINLCKVLEDEGYESIPLGHQSDWRGIDNRGKPRGMPMIRIYKEVIKKQPNFWNNVLFHPTDAVEDPWGKRILDRMAEDGAVKNIRIYTMFEDIVYLDEDGVLQFDFRLSDLRLDYLVEKGYGLLLAYGGMPDCIASSNANKTSVSKNKTRYKGKLFNTSPPRDDALWEEICYEYTRHNVERYGIERVSSWHCQCFNEPDIPWFFMSELPIDQVQIRLEAYCRMYAAFERGIRRVSDQIPIGGPALASKHPFLGGWLDYIRQNQLKLDFISVHNYGVMPSQLLREDRVSIGFNLEKHMAYLQTIREHGFEDTPLIVDEWGMASGGFQNVEECPGLIRRETEVFSAYFVRLIHSFIHMEWQVKGLFLCLSGQHEMTEDFTGFRNFFTLNFIAKPIYNAFILASRLGDRLLRAQTEEENLCIIPTKNEAGEYAVLLSYASEYFEESLPTLETELEFEEELTGKRITLWRIDRETTNPYRLYQKLGIQMPGPEDLKRLRREGKLKPVYEGICTGKPLPLKLTPNAVVLVTVTDEG